MTPLLTTYIRLARHATPETLRQHSLTLSYFPSFYQLSRDRGLATARAWLLGQLIFDLHPEPNPLNHNPSPYPPASHIKTSDGHTLAAQQNIKPS